LLDLHTRAGHIARSTESRKEDGMKTLVATILTLALLVTAHPASAYVVAVTTSIPLG